MFTSNDIAPFDIRQKWLKDFCCILDKKKVRIRLSIPKIVSWSDNYTSTSKAKLNHLTISSSSVWKSRFIVFDHLIYYSLISNIQLSSLFRITFSSQSPNLSFNTRVIFHIHESDGLGLASQIDFSLKMTLCSHLTHRLSLFSHIFHIFS